MTKKNVGGRPRKYSSEAERKKAYRERKKERMEMLEDRVAYLEDLINKHDIQLGEKPSQTSKEIKKKKLSTSWIKLSPAEIEDLADSKIERYLEMFQRKNEKSLLSESIASILEQFKGEVSLKDEALQTEFYALEEHIQQIVLLYLFEAELLKRKRAEEKDFDALEEELKDFEKTLEKKPITKKVTK